jgi:hypothetical protein
MDSVLADAYATVLPAAPYVIAAYALMLAALVVYVIIIVRGMKKTDAQLKALEDSIAHSNKK